MDGQAPAPVRQSLSPDRGRGHRLESWKEIASYLGRHETTVRRWERQEGLPVHRHQHAKLGSVYAFSAELDAWFAGRTGPAASSVAAVSSVPSVVPEDQADAQRAALARLQPPDGGPQFTGRDADLDILRDAWTCSRQGHLRLVLIAGEAGIGKTRLAFEHGREAAADGLVLVGRADALFASPFGLFVELLRPLVLQPRILAGLTIQAKLDLAPLLPGIAPTTAPPYDPVPPSPEGRRFRLFEAVADLLDVAAANRPLLLVLDDLHAADRGSLLLLRHLVRSGRQARLGIVGTFRDTDLVDGSVTKEVLAGLRADPHAVRLSLRGLTDDDVESVVTQHAGRPVARHVVRSIAACAQGNPFLLTELLRHIADTARWSHLETSSGPASVADLGVPQGLADLIDLRLSKLGHACRRLLAVAAVANDAAEVGLLEVVARLPDDDVLDALDEAVGAGILRESADRPGRYGFVHVLTRQRIYGSLTTARRARLHLRIGEALEARTAGDSALAELAIHFAEACTCGGAARAVSYARRAGDAAATALALEDAGRLYRHALRALDFLPQTDDRRVQRLELYMRCGRSCLQAGQWQQARDDFEAALNSLEPAERQQRCEVLLAIAETCFWLLDADGVRRMSTDALTLAEELHRDDLWASAMAWRGAAQAADGDVAAAIVSDRQAIARAGGIRSFGMARAPLTLYWAGDAHRGVTLAADAVTDARRAAEPAYLLYALQHWGLCLSGAGDYGAALRTFDEALAFGRHCGALPLLARATSMSVAPLLALGDLAAAEARARDARELAYRVAFEPPIVSAGIDLLVIYARGNAPDKGEPILPEIEDATARASGWHAWKWRLRLDYARAALALARGDEAATLRLASGVVDQSRARSRPKYEALALALRARAGATSNRPGAIRDARLAMAVASRLDDPAVLLECAGTLLALDGDDDVLGVGRGTAARILGTISAGSLRSTFLASLPPTLSVRS